MTASPPSFLRRLAKAAVVLVVAIALLIGFVAGLYPFLSPSHPAEDSTILVCEGWVADAPLEEALAWADSHGIKSIYITGGPITTGFWLSPWGTYAEMTFARLEAMGVADRYEIRAIPAPATRKDRTFVSAVALRDALGTNAPASMTLASEAPHLRRSALLFRRAFGDRTRIGTLALTPTDFDGTDWWHGSAGVRTVLSEAIAFPYALFSRPDAEEAGGIR